MSDEARDRILARVRAASRRATESDVEAALAALGPGPAPRPVHADPRVALLAQLLRNQAGVDAVTDRTAAVRVIGEFLGARHGSRKLVAGQDPRLAALPWRDAGLLPRFGEVEAGDLAAVSYARLAIGETGSVVLTTGRDNPGRNNLLPEDHIVLVNGEDVIAGLDDLWPALQARLGPEQRPRGLQLISGPSSTADIALEMVFGAHGPRALQVVLVAKDGPDCLAAARALAG